MGAQRLSAETGHRVDLTDASVRLPDAVAPIWDGPIPLPPGAPKPMVWLLGAHGGAGTSTLAQVLAPAAECGRRWPGGHGGQSPFVAVVARETVSGLVRAHELLRQHAAGKGGPSQVVGLITVADRPGRKVPKPIQQTLDLVTSLTAAQWRVGWIEQYPLVRDPTSLQVWSPFDPEPERKRGPDDVPADIAELGKALRESIIARIKTQQS
ncbi:hypothetical protein DVG80_00750 [Rhodococcus erythropolis]|nr:hypothetical protein DVG80_00750 [Rhodococcus erythropolis]